MSTALHLPPEPFAPWAEIVPGYGPVAVDILLTLPDDGYRYEVVEGVLVRMAGAGLTRRPLALSWAPNCATMSDRAALAA